MTYKRRTSIVIEKAQIRSTNLETVDAALDMGNGLSLAVLRTEIQATQALLDAYNVKLAEADGALNAFKAKEKELKNLTSRLLAGVGAAYGRDSSEYEQAGGTRTSDRARKSYTTVSSNGAMATA
jgi:hypothetical protein